MGKQVKSGTKKKKVDVEKEMERPATVEEVKEFIKYVQSVKAPLDVREYIRVDMVFDGAGTRGWVHTHGLWDFFGLPDLEIRDVNPIMLMPAAGQMLNHFAQYMVDGQCGRNGAKPYQIGQSFGPFHGAILSTRLASPIHPDDKEENESHFSYPRYLVFQANEPVCTMCERGIAHAKH